MHTPHLRRLACLALLFSAALPAMAAGTTVANTNITEADIKMAQDAWGRALIQISDDFASGGLAKAKATANAVLDSAYGYNLGVVLFKPTLTHGSQTFRTTRAGALAYFVGDDKAFASDKGFALGGWKKYEYRNAGIFIDGNLALTQGHVMLTNKDGQVTTVDKTWAFKKDERGQLRIVLHHSSLPFQPAR